MARSARGPAIRLLGLIAATAVLAAACSSSGVSERPARSGGRGSGRQSVPPPPTGSASYSLGTASPAGDANPSLCLSGDTCKALTVDCPGTDQTAQAVLDIGDPVGTPRGVLVFLSGGGGGKLWSQEARSDVAFSGQSQSKSTNEQAAKKAEDFLQGLRQQGFMTVQVEWQPPWLAAPKNDPVGPARLACRSATAVKYVHDNYFERTGAHPAPLACGFCITGNSGGASQIAYMLGFYGLSGIIDGAVLTGGPPHAGLAKACLNQPGYEYTPQLDQVLDASYGFFKPERGPCELHTQSWADTWKRDGADTGGDDYDYPDTRVLLLLGALDDTAVGPHQMDYLHRLQAAGSPHVKQVTIPGMSHVITLSDAGLGQISDWFLHA